MDKIIRELLLEMCDIGPDECALLSSSIIHGLEKYIRDKPSFNVLQSTNLYTELHKYGQIVNTITETDHAIVQYRDTKVNSCIISTDTEQPASKLVKTPQDAVRELEGYMYCTVISYPMRLKVELFGSNFLLLSLQE